MTRWALLLGAVVCEVTASLCLKGALTHPLLYALVAAGYISAFVLLGAVLRGGMRLSVAYGIWGALGVAFTALLSAVIYDEAVTALKTIGLVLIIGGVLLIEFGSRRTTEPMVPAARAGQA